MKIQRTPFRGLQYRHPTENPQFGILSTIEWERFDPEKTYDQGINYLVYADGNVFVAFGTDSIPVANSTCTGSVHVAKLNVPELHLFPNGAGC